MRIERGDGKITLTFERSPDQRAMTTLHMLVMGGFVAFVLIALYLPILSLGGT